MTIMMNLLQAAVTGGAGGGPGGGAPVAGFPLMPDPRGPEIRIGQAARLTGIPDRTLRTRAAHWQGLQNESARPTIRVSRTSGRGRAHWLFDELDAIRYGVSAGVEAAREAAIVRGLLPAGEDGEAAAEDAAAPADGFDRAAAARRLLEEGR